MNNRDGIAATGAVAGIMAYIFPLFIIGIFIAMVIDKITYKIQSMDAKEIIFWIVGIFIFFFLIMFYKEKTKAKEDKLKAINESNKTLINNKENNISIEMLEKLLLQNIKELQILLDEKLINEAEFNSRKEILKNEFLVQKQKQEEFENLPYSVFYEFDDIKSFFIDQAKKINFTNVWQNDDSKLIIKRDSDYIQIRNFEKYIDVIIYANKKTLLKEKINIENDSFNIYKNILKDGLEGKKIEKLNIIKESKKSPRIKIYGILIILILGLYCYYEYGYYNGQSVSSLDFNKLIKVN